MLPARLPARPLLCCPRQILWAVISPSCRVPHHASVLPVVLATRGGNEHPNGHHRARVSTLHPGLASGRIPLVSCPRAQDRLLQCANRLLTPAMLRAACVRDFCISSPRSPPPTLCLSLLPCPFSTRYPPLLVLLYAAVGVVTYELCTRYYMEPYVPHNDVWKARCVSALPTFRPASPSSFLPCSYLTRTESLARPWCVSCSCLHQAGFPRPAARSADVLVSGHLALCTGLYPLLGRRGDRRCHDRPVSLCW